jgi:predicted glycoside hydrolase/deacetylase ChbG (UPF0249 family)
MKALYLTADDYGYNPAVDDAVLDLIDAGRLSGAGCMTRAPGWRAAAARTGAFASRAGFGLHLDFTEFSPQRRGLWPLIAASLARRLDARQLRDEITGQCALFEDATGRTPDYVDGHQHVHQLPQIRDALIDVLNTRYAGRLPLIRVSGARSGDGAKSLFIAGLGARRLAEIAQAAGFRITPRLLGVYGFDGDRAAYRQRLEGWIAAARNGDALMCHPATCALPGDPIGAARVREYAALGAADFGTLLATGDAMLAPMRP